MYRTDLSYIEESRSILLISVFWTEVHTVNTVNVKVCLSVFSILFFSSGLLSVHKVHTFPYCSYFHRGACDILSCMPTCTCTACQYTSWANRHCIPLFVCSIANRYFKCFAVFLIILFLSLSFINLFFPVWYVNTFKSSCLTIPSRRK